MLIPCLRFHRPKHLAARLREDVGEVPHDDKGNKPTPPRARDSGDPNIIPKGTQSTSTSDVVDPLSPSCTRTGGLYLPSTLPHQTVRKEHGRQAVADDVTRWRETEAPFQSRHLLRAKTPVTT
jgi:hypothetical protein